MAVVTWKMYMNARELLIDAIDAKKGMFVQRTIFIRMLHFSFLMLSLAFYSNDYNFEFYRESSFEIGLVLVQNIILHICTVTSNNGILQP